MAAKSQLNPRVPITTRAPRPHETNGVNYHFLSREAFEALIEQGALAEHGAYNDNYYGMLKPSVSAYSDIHNAAAPPAATNGTNGTNGAPGAAHNTSFHHHVQTVVLRRNAQGRWGFSLSGGLQDNTLIMARQLNGVEEVAASLRPLRDGDGILAIDGTSVAGRYNKDARQLMLNAGDQVELTVLCRDGTAQADALIPDLFKATGGANTPDLEAVRRDVKADVYSSSVPYTTRAPREGELDGVAYHFVSRERFLELQSRGEMMEVGENNGVLYGTRREAQADTDDAAAARALRRSVSARHTSAQAAPPRVITINNTSSFAALGMGLVNGTDGVFVASVVPHGLAERAGMCAGMQLLAVDGSVLGEDETVEGIRRRLDHTGSYHELAVRFNPRSYGAAAAELRRYTENRHVEPVILSRRPDGSFGLILEGGREEGRLIVLGEPADDLRYVTATERPLRRGDALLAVNGVSVAGAKLADATPLLTDADGEVEITILFLDTAAAGGVSDRLEDFFTSSPADPATVAAAKHDVRRALYGSTVAYTTRSPREAEVNGREYNFISAEQFRAMQKDNLFLEWGERDGVYYGTAKDAAASAAAAADAAAAEDAAENAALSAASACRSFRRQESMATRAARQGANAVQAVLLKRNAEGNFGVQISGGLTEGTLPHITAVDNTAVQAAYSVRPIRQGDALVAINGVSVAGTSAEYVAKMLQQSGEDVELVVLCPPSHHGEAAGAQPLTIASVLSAEERALRDVKRDLRDDIYSASVPYTTRAPREDEEDGRDYHFVSRDTFEAMREAGEFAEAGERDGVFYGTSLRGNFAPRARASRARRTHSLSSTRPRLFNLRRKAGETSFGFDVTESSQGPLVVGVESGSAADRAHIRPAMIVERVAGRSMAGCTLEAMAQAIFAAEKDSSDGSIAVVLAYAPRHRGTSVSGPVERISPATAAHAAQSSPAVRRISLWSAPRCSSTALMYSFAQRSDTTVIDEPFYPAWLEACPNVPRADDEREIVRNGSKLPTDAQEVVDSVLLGACDSPVLFCKHMSKHFTDLHFDHDAVLAVGPHIILTRNPVNVCLSFEASGNEPTLDELGYPALVTLVSRIRSAGQEAIVVDTDALQAQPEATLRELCTRLGLAFDEAMLSWPAGPKPYDGPWAGKWYTELHNTTGFKMRTSTQRPLPASRAPLVEECYPFYDFLQRRALGSPFSREALAAGGVVQDHGMELSMCPEARNLDALIWVNGSLVPRPYAGLSVFDSAVQGGDAVWEGVRVYNGRIFNLDAHLSRMQDSAKAMAFANVPTTEEIRDAIFRTLAANNMRDGVHMRITLTRGLKTTSSMNPVFNVYGCSLIIVPEHKPVGGAATYDNARGIRLISAANRRNPPQCVDSKIHHCNLINNILPKIQANAAGAHDAIMLDLEGFVSETNATNMFAVRRGVVITPHADYCLPGTTRATVMEIVKELGMTMEERRVSLAEFHSADEVFTTGSMGEITPVYDIDGRVIGEGKCGAITAKIQAAYRSKTEYEGTPLPDF